MPVIKRVSLTKVIIEAASPRRSPYRLWDAKVPGLALRVMPSGRKTYELHWGRNKTLALGQHGIVALDAARESAHRVYGEVSERGAPRAVLESVATDLVGLTFGKFIADQYGPHIEATAKAGKATIKNIKRQFGFLDGKVISQVDRSDFDKFKAKRLTAGIRPATVNRDLDRLKAALSKAVEWKLLADNPLLGVKRIKRDIEERVRFLAPKEESRLRKALEARESLRRLRRKSGDKWRMDRGKESLGQFKGYTDHLMPVTLVAINTGLRRGELTQLCWKDIDLIGRRLTVRAGYAKSGKARHLPLNSEALLVLKNYRKQSKSEGAIFSVKSLDTSWASLMLSANVKDFRFHDLRHTFASKLVMAGIDLNTVRELLGHGDIKMTLRYAHLAHEHKAAAVELLVSRG